MKKFICSLMLIFCFSLLWNAEKIYAWEYEVESDEPWEEESTEPWEEPTEPIEEKADFSNARLSTTNYVYTVLKQCSWDMESAYFSGEINVLNAVRANLLDRDEYSYTVEKSKLKITYLWIEDGIVHFSAEGKGSVKINLIIQGKAFPFTVKTNLVKLKGETSILLKKGKTKKISVVGASGTIKWKSSNSKIASVTSKGKVKAKKEGNVTITAKTKAGKLGCIVSVVSKKRYKAIKGAVKIGKTCKYSQAKRMLKGYYDCSSAVWKSYKKAGMYFGSRYYAPTAADNAKWCVKHKKKIKGNIVKNTFQMKYKAGCLFYSVGMSEGRYKNIGHVEMLAGYIFCGLDSKGKAIASPVWAIGNGYIGNDGLVVDPLK